MCCICVNYFRFLRHLSILSIDQFADDTLRRIFSTEIVWHFKQGYELAIHQVLHYLVGYIIPSTTRIKALVLRIGQPRLTMILFPPQLAHPLIEATLQLYKSSLATFLPTPAKCHYMFNLRDFARVVRGVRLVPNTHLRDPNKLIRYGW